MDAGTLKEYRDRWKAVNAILAEERKRLTEDEKLEQLSILFAPGLLLSSQEQEQEMEEIRRRWALLRERLHHV